MSAKSSVLPSLCSRFGTQSRNSLRKLPARHPLPRHEREEPRRPVVPSRDHNLFLPVYLQSSGRGGGIDLNNRSVAAMTLYVSTCMYVCVCTLRKSISLHLSSSLSLPVTFCLPPPCHLPLPLSPSIHPSIDTSLLAHLRSRIFLTARSRMISLCPPNTFSIAPELPSHTHTRPAVVPVKIIGRLCRHATLVTPSRFACSQQLLSKPLFMSQMRIVPSMLPGIRFTHVHFQACMFT